MLRSEKVRLAAQAVNNLKKALATEQAKQTDFNQPLADELMRSLNKARARLAELTGRTEP